MATRKTTTKPRSSAQKKTKKNDNHILTSIVLFGLGIFLIVLSFTSGAAAWTFIQDIYFYTFGYGGYIVGFLMLYIALLIAMHRPFKAKIVFSAIIILLASGILFVFSDIEAQGEGFFNQLIDIVTLGNSGPGGLAVAMFGWPLVAAFGRPVANIIVVLLCALFFMLLTSITPYDIILFFKKAFFALVSLWSSDGYVEDEEEDDDEPSPFETDNRSKLKKQIVEQPKRTQPRRLRVKRNIDIPLGDDAKTEVVESSPFVPTAGVTENGFERSSALSAPSKSTVELSDEETQQVMQAEEGFEKSTKYILESNKKIEEKQGTENSPGIERLIEKAVSKKLEEQDYFAAPVPELYGYELPSLDFFEQQRTVSEAGAHEEMRQTADLLVNTLKSFSVQTRMMDISRGPTITRYELQPLAGVKISKITALADDIALNLATAGVRIEAPIPNKAAVGIEVPNKTSVAVGIRSVLESREFNQNTSPLTIALGQDIAGQVQIADLTRMPHLLIAGSTGSGKSVCINSCIISFLCKATPEKLRLILIDPKVVELSDYNGIPHLLMPVVTEPRKAAGALGAAVAEMERRYHEFAANNVRDINSYNKLAARSEEHEPMPFIAIIIDELADLMMVSGKEVEDYICRIAQKARAAGMHLIVATQRPSVDVITGLIKANIPSRIAFAVSSQVDSRTILDGGGAEKLLGRGDMLYMPVGAGKPLRIQGNFVKDSEITNVLNFVKKQQKADYDEELIESAEKIAAAPPAKGGKGGAGAAADGDSADRDSMFWDAAEVVIDAGMASTSLLQRRLKLGYARAARIMDELEAAGIIGKYEGAKPRSVMMTRQQLMERKVAN